MSVRPRGFAWMSAGVTALCAAIVAAFLVDGGEEGQTLEAADVVGSWSAVAGGGMTVRADGSAELDLLAEPKAGCGQSNDFYSGPARWVFDTYPDESPGIRFDFRGPETGESCRIYLVVFADEGGGKGFLPHNAEVQYVRAAPPLS